MLREPADHALSAFYFHGHSTFEWPSCLAGRCAVTTGAGGHGCCPEQYADGQTRQIGADRSLGVDVYTGALGNAWPLDRPTAARALDNLRGMDIVGITEDHQAFVRMLGAILNVSATTTDSFNSALAARRLPSAASQRRVTLPNRTLASIREGNADDAVLYRLATELAAEDAACLLGVAKAPPAAHALNSAGGRLSLRDVGGGMVSVAVTDGEERTALFPGTPVAASRL